VTSEIEELEREGWEALSGSDGAAFYDDLMTDDGVMVFPGIVMNKPRTLEAIAGAAPWQTFELADVRVIQPTPDTGMVVYSATAQRAGEAQYRAEMTSLYARRDGRWRLVLHQQSPAARPPRG
jgi:uncharacterized protein (TIGR02246 family)